MIAHKCPNRAAASDRGWIAQPQAPGQLHEHRRWISSNAPPSCCDRKGITTAPAGSRTRRTSTEQCPNTDRTRRRADRRATSSGLDRSGRRRGDHKCRMEYELDDDPTRIQPDAVWAWLSTEAYWGLQRTRADVDAQITGAWRVVGAYAATPASRSASHEPCPTASTSPTWPMSS